MFLFLKKVLTKNVYNDKILMVNIKKYIFLAIVYEQISYIRNVIQVLPDNVRIYEREVIR